MRFFLMEPEKSGKTGFEFIESALHLSYMRMSALEQIRI
jgi:hypothetical protein